MNVITNEQGVVLKKVNEAAEYTFHWWDGLNEPYERYIEYDIIASPSGLEAGQIRLAFGTREAYGKLRRRILVFRDQMNVLAEFVGADDYEKSGLVLWLLKKPDSREDVHPDDDIPADYQRFRCVRFSDYVQGPWARGGFAVIVHEAYHAILIEAALVRQSHICASTK